MTTPLVYPLKQVIEVKQRRVDDQEKVVQERRETLKKEQEKLAQREAERDKAKNHYQSKLNQLRDELDHGTTTDKIQQMKAYLKVAKEKVKIEEKKVKEQKDQVDLAEKALQVALNDLRIKRQEVDKLHTHKKDWEKEMRKELEIIEGREQDELGSIIFSSNQRKFGKKQKLQ
jgi:flagellar biosynthesis chaperone FliJ